MSHRDSMSNDDVIMAADNTIEDSDDINEEEPTVVKFIEALAAAYNSKQVSVRFPRYLAQKKKNDNKKVFIFSLHTSNF